MLKLNNMNGKIAEYKIEAYKDDNNTLFVHYWNSLSGWVRDILWADFINNDIIIGLIYRLFDYFGAKYPLLMAHANPDIKGNTNITGKLKIRSVRNFLSIYYYKNTIPNECETDIDITFYTNGSIEDHMDSIDCNVNCLMREYLKIVLEKTGEPDFFRHVKDLIL